MRHFEAWRNAKWSRRTLMVAIAAFLLLAAACGGDDDPEPAATTPQDEPSAEAPVSTAPAGELEGREAIAVTFGGDISQAFDEAYFAPVEDATGLRIDIDEPTDYARLQAQVESGNVSWSIVEADPWFVETICGTLAVEINVDRSDIDERFDGGPCGVAANTFAFLAMYDTELFADDPPSTWADFFDTATYPGARAVWGGYSVNGLVEAALLADGVAPENLYPLDLDRAYAKLATIQDDLQYYDTIAQQQEILQSGGPAFVHGLSTIGYIAAQEGTAFAPMWSQAVLGWDVWMIPKGADIEAATAIADRIATHEAQTHMASISSMGYATLGDPPDLTELQQIWSAGNPDNIENAIVTDQTYYAENFDPFNNAWVTFIQG